MHLSAEPSPAAKKAHVRYKSIFQFSILQQPHASYGSFLDLPLPGWLISRQKTVLQWSYQYCLDETGDL